MDVYAIKIFIPLATLVTVPTRSHWNVGSHYLDYVIEMSETDNPPK